MSGGEQQRVAIARAVIGRPRLLLADEPTGNLDEIQAERLMQLFKEMNRLGTTVVVATHNDALVGRHPAPSLRLRQGRLVAAAPPRAGAAGSRALRPRRHRGAGLTMARHMRNPSRRLRPAGFDELGLRRAVSDRMLPFLVGAMAFLAALALGGWIATASLAQHWRLGAAAAMTVQVPHPTEPAAQGGGTRLAARGRAAQRHVRHRRGARADR